MCGYLRKLLPTLMRSMPGVRLETIGFDIWSPGYFVSSVGIDEEVVRNYVENQGNEDSGQLRMQL